MCVRQERLTTFSWIWELDTDMLMDSSSATETQTGQKKKQVNKPLQLSFYFSNLSNRIIKTSFPTFPRQTSRRSFPAGIKPTPCLSKATSKSSEHVHSLDSFSRFHKNKSPCFLSPLSGFNMRVPC